ncbi:hypothetical protein [Acinetobacter johnsonii]|uniref:hypothetical protein n=1 Tax=Acinetobacter johnsonii TaxID=40214 RepID=UPI00103CAE4E|nr:hypothetical protein [Acinetobacter johnsonii]QBK70672.1 hypothetical protein E0Z08_14610 [Acinetobacter johnsonii]
MIRALLAMGIPHSEAVKLPIDVAIAMLVDERPNNTRPKNPKKQQNPKTETSTTTTTKVATKRRHSQPKA